MWPPGLVRGLPRRKLPRGRSYDGAQRLQVCACRLADEYAFARDGSPGRHPLLEPTLWPLGAKGAHLGGKIEIRSPSRVEPGDLGHGGGGIDRLSFSPSQRGSLHAHSYTSAPTPNMIPDCVGEIMPHHRAEVPSSTGEISDLKSYSSGRPWAPS